MDEPYVYISVDIMIEPFITKYLSNLMSSEKMGEAWSLIIPKAVSLVNHTIAALALLNQNIIVDVVINDKDSMQECIELLSCYPVTFVGVHCPIEELERREVARGDRQVGLARWQFPTVHADKEYDITVDTMKCDPLECALRIKEGQNIAPGGAFICMKNRIVRV